MGWNEYHQVEKRALDMLAQLDYRVYDVNHTAPPPRESEAEVLLIDHLRQAIKRINPWISDNNLSQAVNEIRPVRAQDTNLMEANEQIYRKLVSYISLPQDLGQGKKNQTIKFIDFDNPDNNEFMAINQYKVKGTETIKPDITVFINGIPVAVIECKNPATANEPEEEAINQLRRYQGIRSNMDEGAEMLFYPNQMVIAAWKDSASISAVGSPARFYEEWKDPYPYKKEHIGEDPTLQDILLHSVFKKEHLLDLIQNFIVFERKGNDLIKMMARYQQYRAVTKALERIQSAKTPWDRNGTIWHTQGSGKSLSMLFLALKLRRMKELGNPTLLIVTDRVSLDNQISGTFNRCGFPNPIQAESVKELREILTTNVGKTIMTTVHKFQVQDGKEYPLLTRDENIFVMVDEAHRTQYKDLASNMRKGLPNACYIGFTGTPIEKKERSTIRTFGDYIDTYTIEESVADGATLPILYEGRLPELKVEGKDLDDIFDRVFQDYSDEQKQKIKEKHATAKDIAEATSRIECIAFDIIKHYEEKIYPLKAQLVTVSRLAAARYGEAFKKLNGPEAAVVISGNDNDVEIIKKYHTTKEVSKQLIDKFIDHRSSLRFLIVCDQLLTGFDAPVEQVMYLDKPLKEHNLLQAIARVNRRFDEKNYGLVVDYYGVFDYLKDALAVFNSKDVKNAALPVEDERPMLEANYREVMRLIKDINDIDDCVLAFQDEEKRLKFKKAFKAFAKSMDIIMPSPIADPYREDLKKLGRIYKAVRNHYRDRSLDVVGVGHKVKELIDEHIRAVDIALLNDPVSILDKEKFEEAMGDKSDEVKASEMEKAIDSEITIKIDENPVFYQSLKERLEDLIEQKKQGMLSLFHQIQEMQVIIQEIRGVRTKAERLGLTEREYALYELLLSELVSDSKEKGHSGDSNRSDKILQLAKSLMEDLEDMAVVEWKIKDRVLKDMKKHVKITLNGYKEFQPALEEITTKVIKLAQAIL